jgi:hypothetical protein
MVTLRAAPDPAFGVATDSLNRIARRTIETSQRHKSSKNSSRNAELVGRPIA